MCKYVIKIIEKNQNRTNKKITNIKLTLKIIILTIYHSYKI